MKQVIAAICCSLAVSAAFAQTLSVDWTWKKSHYCDHTSPEITVGNIPAGTKKLHFQMNDLDFRNFDHGGGSVDFAGGDTKLTIAEGALKQYRGPCPRDDFNRFGHDYVISVKALGGDGAELASGSKKQTFSSSTAK